MGAYMYPIKINKRLQLIQTTESHVLDCGALTLAELRKYVKEGERFIIHERESSVFDSDTVLMIYKTRLETDEERDLRVAREKSYMAEYNKRHKK